MLLTKESNALTKLYYVFGTIVKLTVYGDNGEESIIDAVQRLYEIDDEMSVFKDYSDVSRINDNAGGEPQKVSGDTYNVVKKAIEYSRLSGGTFDPTMRALTKLWGIGTVQQRVPFDWEITQNLELVNYIDISLSGGNTIKLNRQGQNIDLGGIAKGFAADEVKDIFIKNSIESAIIDLGGNIAVMGKKPNGKPWNIGLQNPFKSRGECAGIITVSNKSIVTSGNYERYFMRNGRRYHHIIDPLTGYPSQSGIISATIISDSSIDGDGLSTSVFIMGLYRGIDFIEAMNGIEAIFITEDKKIYATSGIKENFKLCSSEFVFES